MLIGFNYRMDELNSMPEYSVLQWGILSLAAFVIGFSKTGMPGAGILAVPLLALVIPAKVSTGVILPMLIAGDVFAVAFYRRHADWSHLLHLMPWAFLGIVAGYFALDALSDSQLRPVIGAVILAMIAMNLHRSWKAKAKGSDEDDAPPSLSPRFAASMGVLGGAVTMMANAAGPVVALYMLAMRLPKSVFVGTGAWFFLIVNCVKVPFSANLGLVNKGSLLLNLSLLPLIVIGALAGLFALKRLPEKAFSRLVLILAALAALKLIF